MFNFTELYQILIVVLSFSFIVLVIGSYLKNRNKIAFYKLILREDGKPSKVGIAFCFILLLLVYQIAMDKHVNDILSELLAIIFGAELGTKSVDTWKNHLASKKCESEMPSKDIEDN